MIISLIVGKTSSAQQFDIRVFGQSSGLSSPTIIHIFEDSRENIWLASQDGGAMCFNGKTFKTYRKKEGLVDNNVYYISEDAKGNIWIATGMGISKFNGTDFTNYSEAQGLTTTAVYSLLPDGKSGMIAATRGGGIFRFDANKWAPLSSENALPSKEIYSLSRDKQGLIWIGMAEKGLASYDGKKFSDQKLPQGLATNTIFSTYCDSKNRIWMGTPRGNVMFLKNGEMFQVALPKEAEKDFIGGFTEDATGRIWIATEHGAVVYDGNTTVLISQKNGLSSNLIQCLASDKEGNIWIGTAVSGVNVYCPRIFSRFTANDGLSTNDLNTGCLTPQGNLLVGTAGKGIDFFDGMDFSHLDAPECDDESIISMYFDRQNHLWVGTRSSGLLLYRFEKNQLTFIRQFIGDDKIVVGNIVDIIEDTDGTIWIGSYGSGIVRIGKDYFLTYFNVKHRNGPPSDNIVSLFLRNGKIWTATSDSGVYFFDSNRFQKSTEAPIEKTTAIWSASCDNLNRILIATNDSGIIISNEGKSKSLGQKDGLLSQSIKSVYYNDSTGEIWAASDLGIDIFTIDKYFNIQNHRSISRGEGLKQLEISQLGFTRFRDKLCLFTSASGMYVFDLANTASDLKLPDLKIDEILLFNKIPEWNKFSDSVNSWTGLPYFPVFNYDQNQLLFRFSAKSVNQDRKFQFYLEGSENVWSLPTSNTDASYSSLAPGDYRFHLRLMEVDGKTGIETVFIFRIKPPFWNTWWFRLLLAISLISIIWLYIKYREKSLLENKRNLEKQVEERTSDLKKEKDLSEKLLLNILPAETAEEIKRSGTAKARSFEEVTVMFTDFKNFTSASELMTPEELVKEINFCYSRFDEIISEHGIEKIKTIGDSYMCAGGLPVKNNTHPFDVINASIALQLFMEEYKHDRAKNNIPFFELRLGIHTGPVVAGIVGIKKFAYDIWGDTVNTASRMESSGEVGKINISGATYQLVKDSYKCTYRGKVEAKNKGAIDMYFVNGSNAEA